MRYTALLVLGLAACSPAGDASDAVPDDGSGLTVSLGGNDVPEGLFIQCELPMMFGELAGTENRDFIAYDGKLRNYSRMKNEISDNCSPAREGCRDTIEDGQLLSERSGGFNDDDDDLSIVKVDLETLKASKVIVEDGKEVPSDDEVTCTSGEYPADVSVEFGL